ncbi:MAG: P-loop NTPase [Fimbriimonadaceae bacterium]|jgi:flagellar biosynthesis protein FlhG|nr:P-loop NTPase [Fimbriimonadaceae bacterium]
MRAHALPLKFERNKVVFAISDPVDYRRLQQLQYAMGRDILVVRVPPAALNQALKETYGHSAAPEVAELVKSVTQPAKSPVLATSKPHLGVDWKIRETKVIAITSGKGGVGKSTITANLAISLAQYGFKVGIIDADFGLANVHLMMGVEPGRTMADVILSGHDPLFSMTVCPTGVQLLAGSSGVPELIDLDYKTLEKHGSGYERFRGSFHYLLVDTAAGVSESVLSLVERADETIFIVTPEPSSVHDAFIAANFLHNRRPLSKIGCLVNQASDDQEAVKVFAKFRTFFDLAVEVKTSYLGFVREDSSVTTALKTRTPLVLGQPKSRAAQDINQITRRLAEIDGHLDPEPVRAKGFWGWLTQSPKQQA